jgi:hypothetical protein
MKKLKLLAFLFCIFINAQAQNEKILIGRMIGEKPVLTTDPADLGKAISSLSIASNSQITKLSFETFDYLPGLYLFGAGHSVSGVGSVVVRAEVTVDVTLPDQPIYLRTSTVKETCTGVNCEKCSFADKGGCNCDRTGSLTGGSSYCNHSVTKGGISVGGSGTGVELTIFTENTVLISPNPTLGDFNINLTAVLSTVESITVANQFTNQLVYNKTSNFLPLETINMTGQPSGYYIVTVKSIAGGVVSKRIQLL